MTRLHCLLVAVVVACCPAAAPAQEPIRFARTPDISPDGKLVAFTYLGDIWVVDAVGGIARPVTMHIKHDTGPVFSPDGKHIAFSSNRHGTYDVFVVPVQGGKPRRLTYDAADDHVTGWSPDGRSILFTSNRGTDYPATQEMYLVPVDGGAVRRVSVNEGREGVISPAGDQIAYVRGPGTWYRKGYRGTSNDDIWLCNIDGGNNRRVTTFDGQDNAPMWSADGRHLYFVSECCSGPGGVANVVKQELSPARNGPAMVGKPVVLTGHKEDRVRRARINASGEWIVYECGADLWMVSTKTGQSRKLAIEAHADDKTDPERTVSYTTGASQFAISQDDKYIAVVVHGEIFVMQRGGGKAKRVTDHPANDHGVVWSPDAKKLLFLSDRDGQEDVYILESDDPETTDLFKAHKFKVRRLTNTAEAELGLNFSPDGRRVSFLRAGKLVTMNPDGGDLKVIVDKGMVIDYEWSPDSKWVAFSRMDGHFSSEIYITPAGGATPAEPVRNVTRYATWNTGVSWSKFGNKLAFVSDRVGNGTQLHVMSLLKPAVGGVPVGTDIDWEDVHLRVTQISPMDAWEGAVSPDGTRVAFRGRQNGDDLWVATTDGKELTRLTTGNMKPSQIQWSRGGLLPLIYFKDGNGQLRMTTGTGVGTPALVPFEAKMTIRRDEEFAELFEQSWRALHENFYDEHFHGVNWLAVRDRYRPLVKHVSMREDFDVLISLMLGELNASHLGLYAPQSPVPQSYTAELGLIFDHGYRGPGLKIAEVLKRGPADKRGIFLKPGDVIESIDRVQLTDRVNVAQLLNDRTGETLTLTVARPGEKARKVDVAAVDRGAIRKLMYQRWVEHNAKRVAELSKGKLGYIHIPSMDYDGLTQFMRSLYSDNFDKDAIVLDVRFNGGGFTHDKVLNYLGGRDHTFFLQRNGGTGTVLRAADRKWSKPLVLLINNRSYSDAEIFPNAFRALGLGKLVGQATGNHVIATNSMTLIDGSTFRLPRTGVFTPNGVNLEKVGVSPDVLVETHPDQVARGLDAQLDKAVEVLQQDVIQWQKTHPMPIVLHPGGGGATPVVAPMDPVMPPKK
jgi:tricorn protease